MRFLNGLQPLGLRIALGVIFIYHGYPKLVHPTTPMREFFIQHGLPAFFMSMAGIVECFGGTLLLIGLFLRPAALLLSGEMAVAIWKVHSFHGVLSVRDYEFPLALCAACFALATVGAGSVSLDSAVLGEHGRRKPAKRSN